MDMPQPENISSNKTALPATPLNPTRKLSDQACTQNSKALIQKRTPDEVKAIIVNGKNAMPPVGAAFNPQDLNDLLAYLRTQ